MENGIDLAALGAATYSIDGHFFRTAIFSVSSLINTLKSEIARVTRKEMTDELLALRKASTAHRSEIAAMMKMGKREAMRQVQA